MIGHLVFIRISEFVGPLGFLTEAIAVEALIALPWVPVFRDATWGLLRVRLIYFNKFNHNMVDIQCIPHTRKCAFRAVNLLSINNLAEPWAECSIGA
jgi:hypothetical protein